MASYLIFLLSVVFVFCKVHLNTIQKGVEDQNSYVTKKLFEGTIKHLTDLILTMMQMTEKVHINVGGVTFITRWSTLKKYPDTLLGALTSESGSYNAKENCFYFDRNPEFFNTILDFYRNDAIHINNNVCPWIWKNELAFWKIPLTCLSECCYDTIAKFEKNKEIAKTLNDIFSETDAIQHKTSSLFEKLRHHLWRFLDEPNSSRYAKVFSVLYLMIVLISALIPCLSTHPSLREPNTNITSLQALARAVNLDLWVNLDSLKETRWITSTEPDWIYWLNVVINIFFTIETALRVFSCPSLIAFIKDWLNVLDVILVCSMWTHHCLTEYSKFDIITNVNLAYFFCVCEVFSVLRLCRFLRFAKQYNSLKILILSFRSSIRELVLLCISFLMFAWIFANLIFFAEIRQPDTFPNMLVGFWWSVVTMTTVGYGDVYPLSVTGRVVGAVCTMCGLLVIAMPIAVIAGTFDDLSKKKEDMEAYRSVKGIPFRKRNATYPQNNIQTTDSSISHIRPTQ